MKPFLRARVVHTFHGVHTPTGWKERLKVFIDRCLARWTDHFISVSPAEREVAVELGMTGDQPVTFVPNGIDTTRFGFSPLLPTQQKFRVGLVLRDDPVKGFDLFLRELAHHSEEFRSRGVLFRVAGMGEEFASRIPDSARELVEFLGVVDAAFFLRGLDALVSFSRSEGMPLSVLEALSTGVPCLLSDIPGHRYFGDVVRLFGAGEFSARLAELQEQRDENARRAQQGRAFIEREHTVDAMAARTAGVFVLVGPPVG